MENWSRINEKSQPVWGGLECPLRLKDCFLIPIVKTFDSTRYLVVNGFGKFNK